eukprot:COSAG02_NODE_780_length_17266_cov_3.939244_3_plen_698_part_00
MKPQQRVDCGFPGIDEKGCLAKPGCCFGGPCSATVPCCYHSNPNAPCQPKACPSHPGHTYCPSDPAPGQCDKPPRSQCPTGHCGPPPPPPTPPPPAFTKAIKTVHVVQSCHLDVGFADTCAGITNRYFDKFYLDVIETATNLTKHDPNGPKLTFLTHPYLISLYFDCPEGYPGLHCPDAASKAKVHDALKAGTIYLQGFPHSGEPETFDAGTLAAALEFSRNVSLTYAPGQPPSKTYSQRDVPGITRAAVPVFAKHGVEIVSIGSNGANEAPTELPGKNPAGGAPVFRWQVDGAEVFVLWHTSGYGGDKVNDCHIADDEALCPDWVGDNGGARSEASVIANFAAIQKEYPQATVQTSTFDAFLPALKRANASGSLPVLMDEVGDTWIHGMQSDPFKTRAFRTMQRARSSCVARGGCTEPEISNFTRLMMKNGEHTWGKDVKTWLGKDQDSYNKAWNNHDLANARRTKKNFQDMEASWHEQRLWGIGSAIEALGDHPLAAEINAQLQPPTAPSTADLTVTSKRNFTVDGIQVGFDQTGAVIVGGAKLAAFTYRSYSAMDFANFDWQYRAGPGHKAPSNDQCSDKDFCKTGLWDASVGGGKAESKVWTPTLTAVYHQDSRFVLKLSLDPSATNDYGAPANITVEINVTAGGNMQIALVVLSKTPTRLPEAAFVTFAPGPGNWSHEVLGMQASARNAYFL